MQAETIPVCVGPGGVILDADVEVDRTVLEEDDVEVVDDTVVVKVEELTATLLPSTQ